MGQTKSIDLREPCAGSPSVTASSSAKSRWWRWALALGVVALGGWYYRSSKNASQAADPAAAASAAAKGRGAGGFSAANMVVPVVVATAQRGDLPVYVNASGTAL